MLSFGKVAQIAVALALPTSILLVYWWYKQSYSDEEVYGKKRVLTARTTIIEVLVPQKAVGAIIGRQGAKIKEIQRQTGARLHFKDTESNGDNKNGVAASGGGDGGHPKQRTVIIQGTAESAQQAELMVHQIIAEIPEILKEEIEVPCYSLGRIIGKGGGMIREISRISGAKIFIDKNEDYKSPELPRSVILTGSRQQIDVALELIQEQLEKEEEFRAKMSVTAANREHRPKNKEQKEHIKITAVPKTDDLWDMENSSATGGQDKLPQKTDYIEVYVSAVEHPGHFWVQVVGSKALQLEQIQTDITRFVSSEDARVNYAITEVIPGELVAARYEESDMVYYRAKILGETQDGKVDLYFVDFGDNSFAEKRDIFKLRPDFTSFPFQAIECQLAHVEPVGNQWSDEGITLFEDLTYCAQWKSLFARVVTYKEHANQRMPVVQLVDTSAPQDIDVGAELVKEGYAVKVNSTNQTSQGVVQTKQTTASSQSNSQEPQREMEELQAVSDVANSNGDS